MWEVDDFREIGGDGMKKLGGGVILRKGEWYYFFWGEWDK